MAIEIITEEAVWERIVASFDRRDFFFSWRYHQQCAEPDELPILVVVREGSQVLLALPMLRRPLAVDQFDLVSVYGYTGPLFATEQGLTGKLEEVFNYLGSMGCVSGFARLHPILHENVPPHESIVEAGKTISIACEPSEDRLASYRKNTRYEIRRLAKLGAEVEFSSDADAFDTFVELYYETMNALEASSRYLFERDWLQGVLDIDDGTATVGIVKHEGQFMSAALFTCVGEVGQYFLGGSRTEFSKLAPQKLLLHRACDWAKEHGAELLHLGGGRGSDEDGLYRFKAGFSDRVHPFRLMKFVCDQSTYDDLTEQRARSTGSTVSELVDSGFFPAYRAMAEGQV